METTPSLENKLTIGIIGIGGDGSIGAETVKELCLRNLDYIGKIYVKSRDNDDSRKGVINNFIKKIIPLDKQEKVHYAETSVMKEECDIIITGFETTLGAKTKSDIQIDSTFRQRLFNGNIHALYDADEKDKDGKTVQEGLINSLKGYKGLVINATNPIEGMSYWMQELIGLSKDQVIGFMPDSYRFNLECEKKLKSVNLEYNTVNPIEKDALENNISKKFGDLHTSIIKEITKKYYTDPDDLIFDDIPRNNLKENLKTEFTKKYAGERDTKLEIAEIKEIAGKFAKEFTDIYEHKKGKKLGDSKVQEIFDNELIDFHEKIYDNMKKYQLGAGEGFVLGEHSPNLIGIISTASKSVTAQLNKNLDNLEKETRKYGVDLMKYYGATGAECSRYMADLIARMYHEIQAENNDAPEHKKFIEEEYNKHRFCVHSHYINLPDRVINALADKFKDKIKGTFTGVPVWFRAVKDKEGRTRIRSFLDPKVDAEYIHSTKKHEDARQDGKYFEKKHYDFAFSPLIEQEKIHGEKKAIRLLTPDDQERFVNCIKGTVLGDNGDLGGAKVLETILLKETRKNKKPGYLVENDIAIAQTDNKLLMTENLRCNKNKNTLFAEGICSQVYREPTRRGFIIPAVTCFATNKNRTISVTQGAKTLFHAQELPYINSIEDIAVTETEQKQSNPINLDTDNRINFLMWPHDNVLYFAEDSAIGSIDLDWKCINGELNITLNMSKRIEMKNYILSFAEFDNHIFCGLSNGEVHEFDAQLKYQRVYLTNRDQSILKIKPIQMNMTKPKEDRRIYAMNDFGEIFRWIGGNPVPTKVTESRKCFDVAEEIFEDELPMPCVYSVHNNFRIKREIDTDDLRFKKLYNCSKIENIHGEKLKDILAIGKHKIYLIPSVGAIVKLCRLDKEKPEKEDIFSMDIFQNEILTNLQFIKYRK